MDITFEFISLIIFLILSLFLTYQVIIEFYGDSSLKKKLLVSIISFSFFFFILSPIAFIFFVRKSDTEKIYFTENVNWKMRGYLLDSGNHRKDILLSTFERTNYIKKFVSTEFYHDIKKRREIYYSWFNDSDSVSMKQMWIQKVEQNKYIGKLLIWDFKEKTDSWSGRKSMEYVKEKILLFELYGRIWDIRGGDEYLVITNEFVFKERNK